MKVRRFCLARTSVLTVSLLLLSTLLFSCGEDLEGPEVLSFSGVDLLKMEIERGDVQVFGSDTAENLSFHRWRSSLTGFAHFEEQRNGAALEVRSRCESGASCRVRYDGSLRRTARLDVELGQGHLELLRLEGPTSVQVGDGTIRGGSLRGERFHARLKKGEGTLYFTRPPRELHLEVGTEARFTVHLPDVRFRCAFDVEAEQIAMEKLRCHGLVDEEIKITPPDGRVRFVIND